MLKLSPALAEAHAPLLRVRKSNAVYHALKRSILLREALPGEAIVEQHIAQQMGCSQGTVREALLRLQEDGLVARRGYQGTVVSTTSPAEAAQMARIRIDLETDGIRLAAAAMPASDIDALNDLIARMEAAQAIGDDYQSSELDREFHLTIFQASGLTALEPILMRCALHMHRYTFGNEDKEETGATAGDQHRDILKALENRDADAAAQILEAHIMAVIDFWSPTLRRAMDGDGADVSLAPASEIQATGKR